MGIFGGSQAGQPRYSGELHNLQLTESVYGTCAPIVFGTIRVHAKLLFYGGFYAVTAPNSGGKGIFGGKATEWDYYADVLMLLAQGSHAQGCQGILNVWDQQGKLQNESNTFSYTISGASPTYTPASVNSGPVGFDFGVFSSESYIVTANDYGAGGTVTLSGNQNVNFVKVSGSPSSGQYSFNPSTGTYTFSAADDGKTVTITYSQQFSLYYFEITQAAEIPSSPYQVSTDNQAYFYSDQGVTYVDTGLPCTAYSQSNGVYTFTISDVGRYVYINYTYTSSSADLTNSSSLNLTFFSGAQGQSPWAYMTSKYPGSNFGYSALCYLGANPLYLGESGSMPSYNYELVGLVPFGGGILDAHPCDALRLLLTDPLLGVGFPAANLDAWTNCYAYWASNGYLISKRLDTQSAAAEALEDVIKVGNVAPVWSGGLLKLIPYGDTTTVGNGYTYTPATTPAATLTWDDLLPPSDKRTGESTSDDPLQVTVKAPQDCMNYVQCQWTNRTNGYNNELTPEQNDAFIKLYGFRPESPQTWDFITTQAAATWALNLRLKRNCYIRNNYKFWLPFWFSALEPMDLVVLPTGEPVRITSIEDDPSGRLAIEAEQWTYGSSDVTIYTKQGPSSYQPNISQALPGNAVPIFIQNTQVQSVGTENVLQIAASGQNPNWGGCNVLVSLDGVSYTNIGKVMSPSVIGMLTANLPSGTDPDTTDTLSVDISIGAGGNQGAQLVSVTKPQADTMVTLAAIIDQNSDANELIAYETATLTAQNRYNLNYLRRGVYGTKAAAHTTGAWFAYLGTGYPFLDYQYPTQFVGGNLYVKLQSFNLVGNQLQNLAQCVVWTLAIGLQGCNVVEQYTPTTYSSSTTGSGTSLTNPTYAYDKNFSSAAIVSTGTSTSNSSIYFTVYGFPSYVTTAPMTLYVNYSDLVAVDNATNGSTMIISYNGVTLLFAGYGAPVQPASAGTVSVSIPAGTNIDLVSASIEAAQFNTGGGGITASININEIWIQ